MASLTRRTLLTAAAVGAAGSALSSVSARAADAMPYHLDPLPYPIAALEPHIDSATMQLHHDKHHAAYVANLNAAAKVSPQFASRPMEEVLANLGSVPESVRTTVRNNLGGHVNHTMFWQIMAPGGQQPEGDVLAAITRDFGGLEKLQADFNAAGLRIFGSGWVFVTVSRDGVLALDTRPNQDTPLMDGKRVLFGNDVWEHAYYLHYQNRRADYLKAWWNVVDWHAIAGRYEKARQGTLTI